MDKTAEYLPDTARLVMALRKAGITNAEVIGAMEAVPRRMFIPEQFSDRALDNTALPIDCDQTISQPSLVALMTEALELNNRSTVLEIGTGSGYQTAILSGLARRVHTIERHEMLAKQAAHRFEALKLRNITAHIGDGTKGWSHAAPYSRIIVTAAAETIPEHLLEQLSDNGIMVIPVGKQSESQQLLRIKKENKEVSIEELMPVRFVPLVEE